jgi:hypothetical protein
MSTVAWGVRVAGIGVVPLGRGFKLIPVYYRTNLGDLNHRRPAGG